MVMTQKDYAEIQTFLSSTRLNTYGQNLPVKKTVKRISAKHKIMQRFLSRIRFF